MNVHEFRWSCAKHGEHVSILTITIDGVAKNYCLFCFDEVLTRLGMHGMFPVGIRELEELPAPSVESWIPEELDLLRDEG